MLLQEIKTYTLSCTYLGQTSEKTGLRAADLEDTSVLSDIESGFPGGVWKWSGNTLTDGHGNHAEPSPLEWARGSAAESGIRSEGLSASGRSAETFKSLNDLLEAAERAERLLLLDEDGKAITDADEVGEADWDVTFDTDHANTDVLAELDSAEWELEETGLDAKALLDALLENETIRISRGDDGEEAVQAAHDVVREAGWVLLATWGQDEDSFDEVDNHGAGSEESFAALAEIASVNSIAWEEMSSSNYAYATTRRDYFCLRADLERVQREFEADAAIFSARIEEEYQAEGLGHEQEVDAEAFELFTVGRGIFAEPGGYIEFEGAVFTKAERGEGDWNVYERSSDGAWSQR